MRTGRCQRETRHPKRFLATPRPESPACWSRATWNARLHLRAAHIRPSSPARSFRYVRFSIRSRSSDTGDDHLNGDYHLDRTTSAGAAAPRSTLRARRPGRGGQKRGVRSTAPGARRQRVVRSVASRGWCRVNENPLWGTPADHPCGVQPPGSAEGRRTIRDADTGPDARRPRRRYGGRRCGRAGRLAARGRYPRRHSAEAALG